MPAIDRADLLDDSSTRLADIELILLQAARSFFDGKINPSRGDDDCLRNRYIRVETLDTHIPHQSAERHDPPETGYSLGPGCVSTRTLAMQKSPTRGSNNSHPAKWSSTVTAERSRSRSRPAK